MGVSLWLILNFKHINILLVQNVNLIKTQRTVISKIEYNYEWMYLTAWQSSIIQRKHINLINFGPIFLEISWDIRRSSKKHSNFSSRFIISVTSLFILELFCVTCDTEVHTTM